MENDIIRNKTITDITNINLINSLLGIFPQSNTTSRYLPTTLDQTPFCVETEKYFIFFTPKGGGSFINKFHDAHNLKINIDKENDYLNSIKSAFYPFNNINSNIQENELDLLLNGKSKKDLIIVTRNPIYKFLSGIYQDLIKDRATETNSDITQEISDTELQELVYNELNNRFLERGDICTGHSMLFNKWFYLLLTLNKIDTSKLFIVDIDNSKSSLSELFLNYYPELEKSNSLKTFWTHRNKHKSVIESLMSGISKNNNNGLMVFMRNEISLDFYFYNLIQEVYKNNMYIQKV